MGQIASRLSKPLRNFNIDNRAAKVLERREKVAEPAPKHETTANKISQFRAEHPEYMEAVTTKDESLHEKLKSVYIESTGAPSVIRSAQKPLPLSRETKFESDLGAMDIEYEVPEGRADLKSVLEFLSKHQLNPDIATSSSIARDFRLDEAEVQNVLSHFKVLQIHIPQEMYKENKNMAKIVKEQLSSSEGLASNLRLPGKGNPRQGKLPSEADVFPDKS
ncbi:protein NDUFAF4 homolog [Aplysia californica]|uniref:Protein NDUFAF4 homolog n=2 Tax=Aplysia californica TaxID=6500 RepID=A0ABM0JNQ5_APLCA|nr:protein NDUFAF4 homolog [Aplysia californica]